MNDYIIMTDSSCDLTDSMAKELELTVLPLTLTIGDGENYRNLLDGSEISFKDFYARLRKGEMSKTSAVNVEAFLGAMEPILISGKDILYIGFSSGLSATYASGETAAKQLREKYPERKVLTVDTLAASLGEGMLVYKAANLKKEGMGIDELRAWLEENKLKQCHWFTVDDLNFLKRGGRVSASAAMLGTLLKIKPVMHVDDAGHLVPVSKVNGRLRSITALPDEMEKLAIEPENQTIFISHGDCEDEAQRLAEQIKQRLHVKDVFINYVGPVIGAHSGPGTMALFFTGEKR
ncbi:MAG: DegV family protein [Eubacteriales bacterium]|nr:DegV family protein [Eubacteriales bacterium]MDD3881967.1 DegV family protein [Eubacteriales bacterium]MDD4513132.1 DegV family protein [Eubacteriales bacterium]